MLSLHKSRTGEVGVEGTSGKGGEDSDHRLPISRFLSKKLVKKHTDISYIVVGDKSEKGVKGAKGGKGASGGSLGKNTTHILSSKVSSSGKESNLSKLNVTVVLSDDDSELGDLFGPDIEMDVSGVPEEEE